LSRGPPRSWTSSKPAGYVGRFGRKACLKQRHTTRGDQPSLHPYPRWQKSIQRSKTDQKGCWGIRKRATRQGDDGRAVTLRSPTHVGCPVTVLCYGTLVSPYCGTVHGSSHTTQGNFCSFPRSFSFLKHRTNDSNNAQQTYTLRLNRGWGIRPPWKWRLFRLEHVLFLHKPTRSSRENQF